MVTALKEHGLVEPILGFTDNVASDEGTFSECIPSLGKNVSCVDLMNTQIFQDFYCQKMYVLMSVNQKVKLEVHALI